MKKNPTKTETKKPDYHVVSFSGGKDSTAMLLKMIEEGMHIDEIIFCDTGVEFPTMYDHIDKVEKCINRKVKRLVGGGQQGYKYWLTEHPHVKGARSKNPEDRVIVAGYAWPSMKVRWCTDILKDQPREKYFSELEKKYHVIEYIGIAADETKRLNKPRHQEENKRFPLIEWGMSEADCLAFCKEHGFDWQGLYDHFDRVSCWCCPLKNLKELRQLYEYYPDLWQKLREWDEKTWNDYKNGWPIWKLEYRFEFEKRWLSRGGHLRSRAFFKQLYQELEEENERQIFKKYPNFKLDFTN